MLLNALTLASVDAKAVLSALVLLKVFTSALVLVKAVDKPDTVLLKFPTVLFVASNAA